MACLYDGEAFSTIQIMTTATTTTSTGVWAGWLDNPTHTCTSTSATAQMVWTAWSTTPTATATTATFTRNQARAALVLTPEQRAEQGARLARIRAEQAERNAVEQRIATEANARAEVLLLAMLNAEQRETYQRARHIIVVGRSGRRYRVRRGRIGNVDVIGRDGHIESRLCAHPGIWTPDPDVMLAQLLHLQHDDDAFCRTANVHEVLSNEGRILPPLLQ